MQGSRFAISRWLNGTNNEKLLDVFEFLEVSVCDVRVYLRVVVAVVVSSAILDSSEC
jgi:hypothetical protein